MAVVPEVEDAPSDTELIPAHELPDRITGLRQEMMEAAERLEYERAAELRDRIKRLERQVFGLDQPREAAAPAQPPGSAHQHANDAARGRGERHKASDAGEKPSLLPRGRGRGRGARTNGNAPAPRQGSLKIIPDRPK